MRIVYCIAGTRHSGGMERVLSNKANWLATHGHDVHIVTTDQHGEKPFFALDPRIACHDLAIGYELDNGRSLVNKIVKFPIRQRLHRRRLGRLLKELKADVVVSMCCNEAPLLPAINDGSKKVLEVHFSRFKRLQYGRKGLWGLADRIMHRRDKKVARKYDRFVVLTDEDRELWGTDMTNICVIPNAYSFRAAQPAGCESRKVLAVGRFTFQKGFERLIDAWPMLAGRFPDWQLRIIGGGELKHSYQARIDALGLHDSVTLIDSTPDIAREYLGSSILAMTSRYEGLPMALLEAQASGLPIVSFACKCGPRDIIDNGVSGFLVKEGDIVDFATRLGSLMADESLRKKFGLAAYANSVKYSPEAVMARWTTLFNQLHEA